MFEASLYNINKVIEANNLKERPLAEVVPEQYHEFLLLFAKVLADRLPPYQPGIDHEVRLKDRETITWGPLYSMSRTELVVSKIDFRRICLRDSLDNNHHHSQHRCCL